MEQQRNSRDIADVEKAVRGVTQVVHELAGRPSQYEAALRYSMIDPILWSLGWRTWLPWECGPDFTLGRRGRVDYALFDDRGEIAVYVYLQASYTRRRYGRIRLRDSVRGALRGVGILVYGTSWEIYDLSRRTRYFDDKRVETLAINREVGDRPEYVAKVLSQWIGKDQWWDEDAESPSDH